MPQLSFGAAGTLLIFNDLCGPSQSMLLLTVLQGLERDSDRVYCELSAILASQKSASVFLKCRRFVSSIPALIVDFFLLWKTSADTVQTNRTLGGYIKSVFELILLEAVIRRLSIISLAGIMYNAINISSRRCAD